MPQQAAGITAAASCRQSTAGQSASGMERPRAAKQWGFNASEEVQPAAAWLSARRRSRIASSVRGRLEAGCPTRPRNGISQVTRKDWCRESGLWFFAECEIGRVRLRHAPVNLRNRCLGNRREFVQQLMPCDVHPPQLRLGRSGDKLSERLPPSGSGGLCLAEQRLGKINRGFHTRKASKRRAVVKPYCNTGAPPAPLSLAVNEHLAPILALALLLLPNAARRSGFDPGGQSYGFVQQPFPFPRAVPGVLLFAIRSLLECQAAFYPIGRAQAVVG